MANTSQQIRSTAALSKIDEPVSAAANLPIMINRDLSLLEFFDRVLQDAADASKPVLERLKFLAIFSANLDEFFMIRVSGLKEKLGHEVGVSLDGWTSPELLSEIRVRLTEMIDSQKFGITAARNRGLRIEVFTSEDEAVTWLLDPNGR